MMLTADGPRLIEINPRLVGAKIGRLIGFAMGRAIHEDLIEIHLGIWPLGLDEIKSQSVATTRWFTSPVEGVIKSITPPKWSDDNIKCVEFLKGVGDKVRPAFDNAERIGYVMACGVDEVKAEELANRYIEETDIFIERA